MDWNKGGESPDERLAAIDSRTILAAVEDLETLRDRLGYGDRHTTNSLRFDLLRLYDLSVFASHCSGTTDELVGLAVDIADRIDDIAGVVDRLRRAVEAVAALAPDP